MGQEIQVRTDWSWCSMWESSRGEVAKARVACIMEILEAKPGNSIFMIWILGAICRTVVAPKFLSRNFLGLALWLEIGVIERGGYLS